MVESSYTNRRTFIKSKKSRYIAPEQLITDEQNLSTKKKANEVSIMCINDVFPLPSFDIRRLLFLTSVARQSSSFTKRIVIIDIFHSRDFLPNDCQVNRRHFKPKA